MKSANAHAEVIETDAPHIRLERVTIPTFALYWEQVNPLLTAACDRSRGRFSVGGMLKDFKSGDKQFWVCANPDNDVVAFVVTEIFTCETGLTVGNIIVGTGHDRQSWFPLITELEDWFRGEGCEAVQTWARRGWEREYKKFGFSLSHVLLEKRLTDEQKDEGDGR